jgi:hypothetical protein
LIGFGEGMTSMSVPGLPNSLSDMRELQWHGKEFQLWLITIRFLLFWKINYMISRDGSPNADVLT